MLTLIFLYLHFHRGYYSLAARTVCQIRSFHFRRVLRVRQKGCNAGQTHPHEMGRLQVPTLMESRKASCSSVFGQGFPHCWLGAHVATFPSPPPPPPPLQGPPSPTTTTTYLSVVYPSIVAYSNHFHDRGRSNVVRGKWKEGGGGGGGGGEREGGGG